MPTLRRRALFLVGGIVVGLLAVLMALLADQAQTLFALLHGRWPWAPLIVTPAGFALAAWLTRRFFDGAQGSGIPQVIAARQLPTTEERGRLVSLKLAAAKIVLLMLGLASGASAGREGPTVQVGAATMFFLGRIEPHRQPGLLLAGSAAGIAAAFNAPLAGIIFGIEEMSRSFEQRSSILVLVTVIAAGLTSQAILGDYTYFGLATGGMTIGSQWLAVVAASIVGGLCGGLFSRTLLLFADGLPGRIGAAIKRHPVIFAAGCGLLLALAGLAAGGTVFGTGYAQAKLDPRWLPDALAVRAAETRRHRAVLGQRHPRRAVLTLARRRRRHRLRSFAAVPERADRRPRHPLHGGLPLRRRAGAAHFGGDRLRDDRRPRADLPDHDLRSGRHRRVAARLPRGRLSRPRASPARKARTSCAAGRQPVDPPATAGLSYLSMPSR